MSRMPAEQFKSKMLDRKPTVIAELVTLAFVSAIKFRVDMHNESTAGFCKI